VWNHRIGQGARNLGWSYSHFMGALKKSNVLLNRPQLAHLATHHPEAFEKLAQLVSLKKPKNPHSSSPSTTQANQK